MPKIVSSSLLASVAILLSACPGDDDGEASTGTTGAETGTTGAPTTDPTLSDSSSGSESSASTTGGADETTTSGSTTSGSESSTGEVAEPYAAGGPFAPLAGYESSPATGFALLVRLEGGTDVSVQVSGLSPNTDYPTHVHVQPCDDDAAGGHYKIDPLVEDTLEENEIWPSFTSDENGNARVALSIEHVARDEAVSIVVHDPEAAGAKMLCADLLTSTPADPFVTTGTAQVFQAAIDAGYDELAADGTMEREVSGNTTVSITVSGLTADQLYPVHVHDQSCAASSGGGHYKIEYGIAGTEETNELWLPVMTDGTGSGMGEIVSPHLPRAEAQSIVIHDYQGNAARLACIDLAP